MGNLKFDKKELEKLQKQLEELEKGKARDKFFEDCAKELAASSPNELRAILHAAGGSIGQAMYLCEDAERYGTLKKLTTDLLNALTAPAASGVDLLCDAVPTDANTLLEFFDMLKRLTDGINYLYGKNIVEVFLPPVLLGSGNYTVAQNLACSSASSYLHVLLVKLFFKSG